MMDEEPVNPDATSPDTWTREPLPPAAFDGTACLWSNPIQAVDRIAVMSVNACSITCRYVLRRSRRIR